MEKLERRTQVVRLAMSPSEVQSADAVAFSYGLSLPEFARIAMRHIAETRPELSVRIGPRKPGRPPKRHVPQPTK